MDKLLKYLNGLAKEVRPGFATQCGTSEGYLRKAISNGQPLRPTTCVLVERATDGQVTRKDLRPDDWQNIWPELAPSCAANAPAAVTQLNPAGEAA